MSRAVAAIIAMVAASAAAASPTLPAGTATAVPVSFAQLPGWAGDDHAALLAAFRRSCETTPSLRVAVPRPPALTAVCARLLAGPPPTAKSFFEAEFQPWRIDPRSGSGFLTGYFEPEFEGSLTPSAGFPVPVYGRPADLVTRMPGDAWPGMDPELNAARRTPTGLAPFPDRTAVETGALAGQGLEIAWMRDAVDRFVMQVQGSGRLRLPDGSVRRLAYSGRNGWPYTSLGRLLTRRLGVEPAQMTMDRLVAWLKANPAEGEALIRENRSFVFFRLADELPPDLGPIGGEGVPLTPMRSVAADRAIWPYGLPVVLSGSLPDGKGTATPLARAAVIQDTGSAIVGPARIDLFFGSGAEAGHRAGLTRHPLELFVLWPRGGA